LIWNYNGALFIFLGVIELAPDIMISKENMVASIRLMELIESTMD